MSYLRRIIQHVRVFKADIVLTDLDQLTPALLAGRGITRVVFDVDDTLVAHNGDRMEPRLAGTLRALMAEPVIGLYIASNSRRDLSGIAEQLGATVIRSTRLSRKPLQRHYRRILREIGCAPHEAAMVGDRLSTDILGGNLAGMTTILVTPFALRRARKAQA